MLRSRGSEERQPDAAVARVLTFAAAAMLLAATLPASASEESLKCSTGKLKTMTKAFRCLIREDRAALAGMVPHPENCEERLGGKFERLESDGSCPTTGDYATAYAYLSGPEQDLVASLLAEAAASTDPSSCASSQLAAASKYAACRSRKQIREIKSGEIDGSNDNLVRNCGFKLYYDLGRLFTSGGINCVVDGAQLAIPTAIGGYRNYLPGVDLASASILAEDFSTGILTGADFSDADIYAALFRDADLSNANFALARPGNPDFTGANLTGAAFGGATIADATWSGTICPDGVLSDSAGGTCCGHHVGAAPAGCSP